MLTGLSELIIEAQHTLKCGPGVSLGVAELGPLKGSASGILNMAIVGGAVVPVIQGVVADQIGIHHAFFLPVACYLYILFYGLSGSKPNSQRDAA